MLIEQNSLQFEQLELINHLLFLNEIKERLWDCHPNNPDQINVIQEYDNIINEMDNIESQINELGVQMEGLETQK